MTRPRYLIRLLGPPDVVGPDGASLELPFGKPFKLLVYLALSGRAVSERALREAFWPGHSGAHRSLVSALSMLRGAIQGPPPTRRPGEELFVTGNGTCRLNPEVVATDLEGIAALGSVDDAETLGRMVRGPLCAGLEFDEIDGLVDLVERRREGVLTQLEEAARRCAAALLEAGRHGEVVALAREVSRSGLSEGVLAREMLGAAGVPVPAAVVVSDGAELAGHVEAVDGEAPAAAFVLLAPDAASVEQVLAEGLRRRGRDEVALVRSGPAAAHEAPESGLLAELAMLPGGRGTHPSTDEVARRLARGGPAEVPYSERVDALHDALQAVVREQPLILVVPLLDGDGRLSELVGRVLRRGGVAGLTVVAWAENVAALAAHPGLAIGLPPGGTRRLDLRSAESRAADGLASRVGPPAEPAPHSSRGLSPRPRRAGVLLATLLGAAVVALPGLIRRGAPSVEAAAGGVSRLPTGSWVVCAELDGTPRLYMMSGREPWVERVGLDAFASCAASGVWDAERGRLLVGGYAASGEGAPGLGVLSFAPGETLREDWRRSVIRPPGDAVLAGIGAVGPGDSVAVALRRPGEGVERLYLLHLASGRLHPVAPEWTVASPKPLWDPDGRRLFWREQTEDGVAAFVRTATAARTRLPLPPGTDWEVSGVRADTLLVFRGAVAEADDGSLEIGLVDLAAPGSWLPLTRNGWNDLQPSFSPDGTRICWQAEPRGHFQSDIVIHDRLADERRSLELPGRQHHCVWASDGSGVFFLWSRGGKDVLHFMELGAAEPVAVVGADVLSTLVAATPIVVAGGGSPAGSSPRARGGSSELQARGRGVHRRGPLGAVLPHQEPLEVGPVENERLEQAPHDGIAEAAMALEERASRPVFGLEEAAAPADDLGVHLRGQVRAASVLSSAGDVEVVAGLRAAGHRRREAPPGEGPEHETARRFQVFVARAGEPRDPVGELLRGPSRQGEPDPIAHLVVAPGRTGFGEVSRVVDHRTVVVESRQDGHVVRHPPPTGGRDGGDRVPRFVDGGAAPLGVPAGVALADHAEPPGPEGDQVAELDAAPPAPGEAAELQHGEVVPTMLGILLPEDVSHQIGPLGQTRAARLLADGGDHLAPQRFVGAGREHHEPVDQARTAQRDAAVGHRRLGHAHHDGGPFGGRVDQRPQPVLCGLDRRPDVVVGHLLGIGGPRTAGGDHEHRPARRQRLGRGKRVDEARKDHDALQAARHRDPVERLGPPEVVVGDDHPRAPGDLPVLDGARGQGRAQVLRPRLQGVGAGEVAPRRGGVRTLEVHAGIRVGHGQRAVLREVGGGMQRRHRVRAGVGHRGVLG